MWRLKERRGFAWVSRGAGMKPRCALQTARCPASRDTNVHLSPVCLWNAGYLPFWFLSLHTHTTHGLFELRESATWLVSPEKLRAAPEAPFILLQCRNLAEIILRWYFSWLHWAYSWGSLGITWFSGGQVGLAWRVRPWCQQRPVSVGMFQSLFPRPESPLKTHLYLLLFSSKKITFWLLRSSLSGLSWSLNEFEFGLAICGSGFPLTLVSFLIPDAFGADLLVTQKTLEGEACVSFTAGRGPCQVVGSL